MFKRLAVPFFVAVAFAFFLGAVTSSGWQEDNRKQENVVVQPAVQKWEIKRTARWEEAEKLAADGWELVNGTHSTQSTDQYFFKRPKQ